MRMAGTFRRPGSVRESAFGFDFSLDKDSNPSTAFDVGASARIPAVRLPVAHHRADFLDLVCSCCICCVRAPQLLRSSAARQILILTIR